MRTFWAGLSRKAKTWIITGSAGVLLLIIIIASCSGGGGSTALSPKTATVAQICQSAVGRTVNGNNEWGAAYGVLVVTAEQPMTFPISHGYGASALASCTATSMTVNGQASSGGDFSYDILLTPNGQIYWYSSNLGTLPLGKS
jgi:hypothetical protein